MSYCVSTAAIETCLIAFCCICYQFENNYASMNGGALIFNFGHVHVDACQVTSLLNIAGVAVG